MQCIHSRQDLSVSLCHQKDPAVLTLFLIFKDYWRCQTSLPLQLPHSDSSYCKNSFTFCPCLNFLSSISFHFLFGLQVSHHLFSLCLETLPLRLPLCRMRLCCTGEMLIINWCRQMHGIRSRKHGKTR